MVNRVELPYSGTVDKAKNGYVNPRNFYFSCPGKDFGDLENPTFILNM
jgi:hypothetical protein